MLDEYCEWEFGKADFITSFERKLLTVIVSATGAWTLVNIVMMFFIFYRYMVPLRITGKLILLFYLFGMI